MEFIKNLFNINRQNNIYGTVGYTIFKNDNNKVIVFADMHDILKKCSKYVTIGSWLKKQANDNVILLEEVDRTKVKLKQLWPDAPHTQELKNLYLDNKDIIIPVDIRPQLIPFSWEMLMSFDANNNNEGALKMSFNVWLKDLIDFFNLENKYVNEKLGNLDDKEILEHFAIIKIAFENFKMKNIKLLDKTVGFIALNNPEFVNTINAILSDVMEWYCCALIKKNNNKSVIIHAGLAHTTNINKFLQKIYKYEQVKEYGLVDITDSDDTPETGCVEF